jgi:hypothetical protein
MAIFRQIGGEPLLQGPWPIKLLAYAVEETHDDTPYWRTLKNNGELNKKYPGGVERQRARLEQEGHTVIP